MTVIVRLKGEEARNQLELEVDRARETLDAARSRLTFFRDNPIPSRWPWCSPRPPSGHFHVQIAFQCAEQRLDSLLAQLALFDRFPHQAEVILKED